jgi:hypothetical protein
VLLSDRIILFTGTSGRILQLPAASGSNRIISFIAGPTVNNLGNAFIITPHTGDTIGNLAASVSWAIFSGGGRITIQDTAATVWTIVERSTNNIYTKVITTHSILSYEDIVPCDTTGGAFTVTLPISPIVGERHEIHDVGGDAVANNITIAPGGGNKINGLAANVLINTNYETRFFIWTGISAIGWHTYTALA